MKVVVVVEVVVVSIVEVGPVVVVVQVRTTEAYADLPMTREMFELTLQSSVAGSHCSTMWVYPCRVTPPIASARPDTLCMVK